MSYFKQVAILFFVIFCAFAAFGLLVAGVTWAAASIVETVGLGVGLLIVGAVGICLLIAIFLADGMP